jgi:hypothetical protein
VADDAFGADRWCLARVLGCDGLAAGELHHGGDRGASTAARFPHAAAKSNCRPTSAAAVQRAIGHRATPTFATAGERAVSVPVGRSGAFSVALAPGTYHVSGRSPEIMEVSSGGAQHETVCSRPLTVHVIGQQAIKVAVTCIVP